MAKTSTKLPDDVAQVRLLERARKIKRAREHLIDFAEFMMPDPEDPEDATRSLYKAAPHHRLMATALERLERGECMRLAISMPPQHGKTLISSKMFAAWYIGRNPRKNIIFGTYNEKYAIKIGGAVRKLINSKPYSVVFPEVHLETSSRAKDAMETIQGGQLNFVGRGGSGTGLPANLFLIDDPIKGKDEADSDAAIEDLHDWYDSVVYSRARTTTAIGIIHTRWLENDLIGRFCDPDHPWRHTEDGKEEAARWDYINIPAILRDDAVTRALGRQPGEALWPEEFSLAHLRSAQKLNPRNFEALYQGRPTPDDGEYFKADWIVEYTREELPKNLRYYGASDHAVTEKMVNDPSVLGCVGVDENDDIWVLPDIVWERMETDRLVEETLMQMRTNKPQVWWAEDDVIRKSIGPFLIKRMQEERVYCVIDPKKPTTDKRARARAIQGRMSMRKVRFPKFAPWWPRARSELLKFPRATHDDFVDWISWVGLGLLAEIAADPETPVNDNVVRVGSMKWVKARAKAEQDARDRRKAAGGF